MRIRMIWELRPWVGKGKSDTLSLFRARSNRAMSHDLTVLGGGPNVAHARHFSQAHPQPKCFDVETFERSCDAPNAAKSRHLARD